MDAIDEYIRLTKAAQKGVVKPQLVWAIVDDVDWEEKTMTAIGLVDNLEYYDVVLGLGHIVKKPKKGARCLLGVIGTNSAFTFLIECEEVEEMVVTSNNTEFTINEEGFTIKKGNETLKSILNDFIDEVNKIIVVNGTTINVAAVTLIKQRLNTVLK